MLFLLIANRFDKKNEFFNKSFQHDLFHFKTTLKLAYACLNGSNQQRLSFARTHSISTKQIGRVLQPNNNRWATGVTHTVDHTRLSLRHTRISYSAPVCVIPIHFSQFCLFWPWKNIVFRADFGVSLWLELCCAHTNAWFNVFQNTNFVSAIFAYYCCRTSVLNRR